MRSRVDSFESLVFYRGFGARYPTNAVSVNSPRRDRRPKDSSVHFQEVADNWFLNKFGRPYRSGAIFVTSRILTATAHAHGGAPERVMRVVPLSPYSYCWSPDVSDLLFVAREYGHEPDAVIRHRLDELNYRTDDLLSAYESGHEVMLYCDSYAAFPLSYFPRKLDPEGTRILLA